MLSEDDESLILSRPEYTSLERELVVLALRRVAELHDVFERAHCRFTGRDGGVSYEVETVHRKARIRWRHGYDEDAVTLVFRNSTGFVRDVERIESQGTLVFRTGEAEGELVEHLPAGETQYYTILCVVSRPLAPSTLSESLGLKHPGETARVRGYASFQVRAPSFEMAEFNRQLLAFLDRKPEAGDGIGPEQIRRDLRAKVDALKQIARTAAALREEIKASDDLPDEAKEDLLASVESMIERARYSVME